MDDYPLPYVEHNLPLVLLSGLGEDEDGTRQDGQLRRSDSGARIISESPICQDLRSQQLLGEFRAWDGSDHAWNSSSLPGPTGSLRYRMKTVGRAYTLPARKAAPLPQSPGAGGSPPPRSTELHSPLSPLSPGSPVFPDGLLTPLWFSKHQRQVPALFLAFFNITDGESNSQDEQLKSDINAIRSAFTRSGYRTRVAVVLISDKSILHAPELEDRMTSIRRATSLDAKTGLFFNPPMSSQVEVATFVQAILAALQPSCVEYYRDLAKHARRKKVRGGPPIQVNSSIGGASQSTSTYGWSVRYEVKQGVFAELRQEMDVAERHYSSSIEELFSEGGILETTNSWSPRWDEARLLCDAVALRVLRCLLWNRQTSTAAQMFHNYKLRMRDLVDRRGKGSNTYGWDAWEARWSNAMAQLIDKADLQTFQKTLQDDAGQYSAQQIYAMPEKVPLPGDRQPPFNLLHHPGYFLSLFAKGLRARWRRAMAIPEEDRIPPGRSPASSVANRFRNYDLYLVPDPHEEAPLSENSSFDHAAQLTLASDLAAQEFEARRQLRMSEQIRLELASDLVAGGRHVEACKVLIPLWEHSSWREDEWNTPFSKIVTLLTESVIQNKTLETARLMPALTWELLSMASRLEFEANLDIARCLEDWDMEQQVELHIHDKHMLSPINSAFAFKDRQSHVGELLEFQLALTYDTLETARPVQVSIVTLKLGTKHVVIRHDDTAALSASKRNLYETPPAIEMRDGTTETSANLTIHPTQTRIFHVVLQWKEAQELDLIGLQYRIETPQFALTHEFVGNTVQASALWFLQKGEDTKSALLPHLDTKSVTVLPKPPKMMIHLQGLRNQYYTDEEVRIHVTIVNKESDTVRATLVSKVIGAAGNIIPARWTGSDDDDPERCLENMRSAETDTAELAVCGPSDAESILLTLELTYCLLSDPDTPLMKTIDVEMPFIRPFDVKFTFSPRVHLDPWPSYFNPNTCEEDANGICQLWALDAQMTSLVDTSLKIGKLEIQIHDLQGDATCDIRDPTTTNLQELLPNKNMSGTFELRTRKASLEDRRPSHLELSLVVTWLPPFRDAGSVAPPASEATTVISVPRLTIPTSEPRVLCVVVQNPASACATLKYHLENPSAHFLTFAMTMETGDFAFSGPKHRALSLAPLSRHVVEYDVVLHKQTDDDEDGVWISPNLQVVDSYYQKQLVVHPGGENMKLDAKSGELMVWIRSVDHVATMNEVGA